MAMEVYMLWVGCGSSGGMVGKTNNIDMDLHVSSLKRWGTFSMPSDI